MAKVVKVSGNEYFNIIKRNLMLFAGLMVIFLGSFAISQSGQGFEVQNMVIREKRKVVQSRETYPPLPTVIENSSVPSFTAQGVYVKDLDSGVVLLDKNSQYALLPASTVKIMSALVSADYYPFSTILTVSDKVVEGQKMKLIPGERLSVGELMKGLLIFSANDAAEVLADNYFGGRDIFINSMNEKASVLGLKDTRFSTPTGLDGLGQVTTARDMVVLGEYAMRFPWFADIVGTKEDVVESEDGMFTHNVSTTNELLGVVEGVKGVKTGWTENARENLVTYYEYNDKRLVIAVLGSQDRFGETKQIINWVTESYSWIDVSPEYEDL